MAAQQVFRGTPFTRTTILVFFFLTPWLILLVGTALANQLLGRYGLAVAAVAFLLAAWWIWRQARQTVTVSPDRIVWRGRRSRYTIRTAYTTEVKLMDNSAAEWRMTPRQGSHLVRLSSGPALELRLYGSRGECCKVDLTWYSQSTRLAMVRAIIHVLPTATLRYTGPGDAWAAEYDELFPMRSIDGRVQRLRMRDIQNGLLMPA